VTATVSLRDLGYFDEGGVLHVINRKKDMIKTGGENVYKVPKHVHFIESLLKNPSGKLLKRELRASFTNSSLTPL